jgi:hypothetical protein
VLARELARLFFVDDEKVDALEHLRERVGLPLDPEVHRVGDDELRSLDLLENLDLQGGVDVAEQDVVGVEVRLGELGFEIGEHVELRLERDAAHEVRVVAACPAEGLARRALEPREVDVAARKGFEVARRKIVSHDRDDANGRKHRRRVGRIRRRSADHVLGGDGGQLEVVERHRADDEERGRLLVHDELPFWQPAR